MFLSLNLGSDEASDDEKMNVFGLQHLRNNHNSNYRKTRGRIFPPDFTPSLSQETSLTALHYEKAFNDDLYPILLHPPFSYCLKNVSA